jgi:uncharacterized protein (TIGR02117 family)
MFSPRTLLQFLPVFPLLMVAGCLGPVQELYPDDEERRPHPVYVMRLGWHTSIIIESEHIQQKIPLNEHLAPSNYVKFGWGDGRYYPHENPGVGLMIRAALWPTRSVVHATGLHHPPEQVFMNSDVVLLYVSTEGMDRITDFISDRFRRDDNGHIQLSADGLYANSLFFDAHGRYYLPKTSNHWTARALRRGGAPVSPLYAFTAGNLIRQTSGFGEVLRRRK